MQTRSSGESMMRSPIFLLITMAAAVLNATPAATQSYPSKPVRIIIPYAPGGINDVAARVVATHLSNKLGKQFIPDNRTGAGGNIGLALLANAAATAAALFVLILVFAPLSGAHMNPAVTLAAAAAELVTALREVGAL